MADLYKTFSKIKLFRNFSEKELRAVISKLHRIRFNKDETIAEEGEPGKSMFIISEGEVRVVKEAKGGGEIVIARLGAGEVIGEIALMDGKKRSASVLGNSEGVLYRYTRDSFNELLAKKDPAAFKLVWEISRIACERLREVDKQIEHYIANPAKLFEPALKEGVAKSAISEAVGQMFKLFGK